MVNSKTVFTKSLNLSVLIGLSSVLIFILFVLNTKITILDIRIILALGTLISVFALINKSIYKYIKQGAMILLVICILLLFPKFSIDNLGILIFSSIFSFFIAKYVDKISN